MHLVEALTPSFPVVHLVKAPTPSVPAHFLQTRPDITVLVDWACNTKLLTYLLLQTAPSYGYSTEEVLCIDLRTASVDVSRFGLAVRR